MTNFVPIHLNIACVYNPVLLRCQQKPARTWYHLRHLEMEPHLYPDGQLHEHRQWALEAISCKQGQHGAGLLPVVDLGAFQDVAVHALIDR